MVADFYIGVKFRFVELLVRRIQRLLLEEKLSPEATDEVETLQ